jgi:hypothetical protein
MTLSVLTFFEPDGWLGRHWMVQARIDYLPKRANNGALTPDEDAEYEALIDGADLITILKLKAARFGGDTWVQ